MSSGTYFPPPVKAVEIPEDRHEAASLGFPRWLTGWRRPWWRSIGGPDRTDLPSGLLWVSAGRSAHQCAGQVPGAVLEEEMGDRPGHPRFFDILPSRSGRQGGDGEHHRPAMGVAVCEAVAEGPAATADGTLQRRDRGTPQGSAVSPVLANLVMHYAFDLLLTREFPQSSSNGTTMRGGALRDRTAGPRGVGRARGEDGRARFGLASRQNQDRVTARTAAAWRFRAHLVHVPWLCVPLPAAPVWEKTGRFCPRSCPRSVRLR